MLARPAYNLIFKNQPGRCGPCQAQRMQITHSIFKAYDIRGVVPSTLNEDVAEGLGKACLLYTSDAADE